MTVVRRAEVPRYTRYQRYKPILREDFVYRCAYCQTHERVFGELRHMTIDHLRPKEMFPRLRTEYANLYYCCAACNTYKGEQWPSDEEVAAGDRFVDVCQDEWGDHLQVVDGVVTGTTAPGRFTADALVFDRPELTGRNREAAASEAKCRRELQLIQEIRSSLPRADAAEHRRLDELERDATERLNAILEPAPLKT